MTVEQLLPRLDLDQCDFSPVIARSQHQTQMPAFRDVEGKPMPSSLSRAAKGRRACRLLGNSTLALAGVVGLMSVPLTVWPDPAAAQPAQTQAQTQTREQVYGSQLMTAQERSQYRERLRNATSAQEREKIQLEHHREMQLRAQKMGVTLPDAPPMQGGGMGMGPGSGGGTGPMGPGGGMGAGRGRSR